MFLAELSSSRNTFFQMLAGYHDQITSNTFFFSELIKLCFFSLSLENIVTVEQEEKGGGLLT